MVKKNTKIIVWVVIIIILFLLIMTGKIDLSNLFSVSPLIDVSPFSGGGGG